MRKFLSDFKKFIMRGNVVDLAVAVIIGAAFSAIVNSLVADIVMPLIKWAFPAEDAAALSVVLRPASEGVEEIVWHYGNFLQAVINFLLTALVVYMMLKLVMGAKGFITPKYGETLTKEEYMELKKQGKTKEEIEAIDAIKTEEKKAAELAAKAEAEANTTEALLKDIRELLKNK